MASALQQARLATGLAASLSRALREKNDLSQFVIGSAIAFVILAIGIVVGEHIERQHPRIIHDIDVSFEFSVPAVAPVPPLETVALHSGSSANESARRGHQTGQSLSFGLQGAQAYSAQPQAEDASSAWQEPSEESTRAAETHGDTTSSPSTWDGRDGEGLGGDGAAEPAGDTSSLSGSNFGINNPSFPVPSGFANIKGYKQDVLRRILSNLTAREGSDRVIIKLTVARDGHVTACDLTESSGNVDTDKEVLQVAQSTPYAPIPDWYKGDHLMFKLDLSTIVLDQP